LKTFTLNPFVNALMILFCGAALAEEPAKEFFTITVVDEQTGRGVPLVELRTVSEIRHYTDSNGVVAFNEPGLMNRDVFFNVKSHGYTFPKDGFGSEGIAIAIKPGGAQTLKIKRVNIAERLYRITGEGIYRDTVLLGRTAPIRQPLLNAQVSGQDSVQRVEYHGKYFWFYGDTNKPGYPLGHFGTSGAVSEKPAAGGLDPDKGIDLTYFTDANGFSKPMCAWNEPGLKWIDRVAVVRDEAGAERMVARYTRLKTMNEVYDRGLIVFDDKEETFKPLLKVTHDDEHATALTFLYKANAQEYIGFATPYANVRVKADYRSFTDPNSYEYFTCLAPGSTYDKVAPQLDRGADGKLIWAWKPKTSPINYKRQKELLDSGKIKQTEAWYKLTDIETGKPINAANGSIQYNAFRKRWIMIFGQLMGTSMLGEIWISEADTPEGPWEKARKIVTHDQYSFYNVNHHLQFDQDGGRVIYFEGTYTHTFSGNPSPTPRYDYNQIMYRLDLADPRLKINAEPK